MREVLKQFEKNIASIDGAIDELLPPASSDDLNAAEKMLGVVFPDDFREFYLTHNGQKGNLFLFESYRISPLAELLELNRIARKSMDPEWTRVSDSSGIIKECIANPKWIQFGDNGGNTILFLDMDPGQQGTVGQILEAWDGETDCRFNGLREFIDDISKRIGTGELVWDDEAGCFWESDEESVAERERFKEKCAAVDSAPRFDELAGLSEGHMVTLVGAIKPNHKTQKHRLYLRGGQVWVVGDIGDIRTGLVGGPPLVRVEVKVGKKGLFGFGARTYDVISCERIPT